MAQGQASLEYLSDNELYNILKRLRVKDLFKMSTLSSIWKDLKNDANLINLHRAWSVMNPLLLIVTKPSSVQNQITSNDSEVNPLLMLTSVDPADGAVTYQVRIKSCKDNVEVLSSGAGCLFCIGSQGDFIIFNATTKQIQTLPKADDPPLISSGFGSLRSRRHIHPKAILPFVVAVGFGYIESRHVYAVIKLFLSRSCQILLLSETGEINTPWRNIGQKYSPKVSPGNNGIIVRNKCYWMNRDILLAKWIGVSPLEMSILCLDIESELFYVISYPNFATYDELVDDMQLGDLKDELFFGYSHGDPLVMDIWVLKDQQNSDWNLLYRVDLCLIGGLDDRVLSEVKFLGHWEGEKEEVLMFYDSRQQVLLYYNVEERIFKEGKQIQVENHVSAMIPYSERFSSIRIPTR